MMEFRRGDILAADTEALVNTVNCVGVMGRGVALQFKNAFPANFKSYEAACSQGDVQPGRMHVFETGQLSPKYIINFPTKRHWRGKSRLEDIESGLIALRAEINNRNIKSISIPPLGSGLGGLDWSTVKEHIVKALQDIQDVKVVVFEPHYGSEIAAPRVKRATAPSMTPGRAALVTLVNRYLHGLLDPFVTLLEIHKLMYFMQEAGQPLRLQYVKAPYGPYAENLRHVLRDVEGYFLSGYADGGDAPDKQIQIVPGAVEDAEALLEGDNDTRSRFGRVAALVEGFETPFGLELLATVHWIAQQERAKDAHEVRDQVYAWNDRKKQFSERQISLAYERLSQHGWLREYNAS